MKRVFILLIIAPLFCFSQEKVKGVVLDSEGTNALSLSGANVYWQDSQIGVVTDFDGKFSILYKKEFNISPKSNALLAVDFFVSC